MQRGQVVVVAAAIAVVAVFVGKVLSDRTAIDDEIGVGHSEAGPAGGSSGLGSARAPGGSDAGGGGSAAPRSGHHKFDTAAALRAASGGGSGGGVAGPAGARDSGGQAVRGSEPGGGAPRADGTAAHGAAAEMSANRAQRRADVMNMLAQPSAPGGGDAPPKSRDSEVALEVKSTDDSDQASRRENIDTPNDGSDGIKFTDGSQLTFAQAGGASGEQGTITFDVQPEWSGGDATDNSLVQIRNENEWANRLQLVKNGRFLRFILADDTGREADISVPIDEWQAGQSHSVTASWGEGQTSLFIDGRLAGSNTYEGSFNIAPSTPLHLGSDFPSSDYGGANATIRGFTLFKKAQNP